MRVNGRRDWLKYHRELPRGRGYVENTDSRLKPQSGSRTGHLSLGQLPNPATGEWVHKLSMSSTAALRASMIARKSAKRSSAPHPRRPAFSAKASWPRRSTWQVLARVLTTLAGNDPRVVVEQPRIGFHDSVSSDARLHALRTDITRNDEGAGSFSREREDSTEVRIQSRALANPSHVPPSRFPDGPGPSSEQSSAYLLPICAREVDQPALHSRSGTPQRLANPRCVRLRAATRRHHHTHAPSERHESKRAQMRARTAAHASHLRARAGGLGVN